MMTKTHGLSGAATWITLATITRPHPVIVVAGTIIAWWTAKLPDIDHPGSHSARQIETIFPGLPEWLEELHTGESSVS